MVRFQLKTITLPCNSQGSLEPLDQLRQSDYWKKLNWRGEEYFVQVSHNVAGANVGRNSLGENTFSQFLRPLDQNELRRGQ